MAQLLQGNGPDANCGLRIQPIGRCLGGVGSVFGTMTVKTPSSYVTSAFFVSML